MACEPITITDSRGKKYTVRGFVHYRDEDITVPMESLSAEELDRCSAIWTMRMGECLNEYYNAHPEELEKLGAPEISEEESDAIRERLKKRACRPANIPTASAITAKAGC